MFFLAFRTGFRATLARRVVRFALVGAVGIPVNVGFLWLFHRELRVNTVLAWLMAFECSALINFYANQRFTYHDQTHVRGIEWMWRALRAQLSSISGVAINAFAFGLLLASGLHYLEADMGGIVAAFACNFFLASRFVFTPAPEEVQVGPGNAARRARARGARVTSAGTLAGGEGQLGGGQDGDRVRRSVGSLSPAEELA